MRILQEFYEIQTPRVDQSDCSICYKQNLKLECNILNRVLQQPVARQAFSHFADNVQLFMSGLVMLAHCEIGSYVKFLDLGRKAYRGIQQCSGYVFGPIDKRVLR